MSETAAKDKAKSLLRALDSSLVSDARSVSLKFVHAKAGFGCANSESLRAAKTVRLAYVVSMEKCVVFIDAQNGGSLGGKRFNRR